MAQTFTGKMFNLRNQSMKQQIPDKSATVPISTPVGPVGLANGPGQKGQTNNMNMLLTQIFPNNNYTAKHQNLLG